MRKALNENPMVQLAVLGVGVLVLAVIMLSSFGGDDEEAVEPPEAATPAASESAAGETATPPPAPAAAPPPAPGAPAPGAPAPSATPPPAATGEVDSLSPGKGLPEDVLVAYARNKAIALLVVNPNATSDKTVKGYVKRLGGRNDVEVFVVKAKNIARYSRITQGVAVSRTPALVVIRPRDKSEEVRTATVAYGFRGGKSVETALEGALYTGGTRSAAP